MRAAIVRAGLLAALWWALSGGAWSSWLFGIPAIAAALYLGFRLGSGGWRWTFAGAVRFLPFFLWRSLSGGIDVAWRSLSPSLPLDPDLIEYEFRLPETPARVFMSNAISLLPGTLSAEYADEKVRVHTLLRGPGAVRELERLEERVAGLFGLEMASRGDRA